MPPVADDADPPRPAQIGVSRPVWPSETGVSTGQRESALTAVHSPRRADRQSVSSVPAMKSSVLAEQRPPPSVRAEGARRCQRGGRGRLGGYIPAMVIHCSVTG
jgi:hypothetical protein